MVEIGFANYNLKAKFYILILLCLSLAAAALSIFQLAHFTFLQLLMLAWALGVSALINQHQIKIPKIATNFSTAELVVFWGTLWLGAPGGVLLAASAALAKWGAFKNNKPRLIFFVAAQMLAAFVSANVFYTALDRFSGFKPGVVGDHPAPWYWLTAALVLSAFAHYFLSALMNAVFLKMQGEHSAKAIRREAFLLPTVSYCLSIAATFLLHLAFLEFGLAFGWVIIPLAFVGHLAYRLHHKKLEQKTKEIGEASRIHLAMVEALATAIDARDQMGFGHVRRTQIYAVGIGELLDLSNDEIQALRTGALLHDIGKLAVPDHILNKPGRLTPAELEKTKIHPSVGAAILGKVDFNYPVVPTVKYHHECWDGSGYPEGLEGTEIPLTARILSVADAYDTLRGARPYRAAIPRDEARRYLLESAGRQFDPKIVDLFLRNLKKFELQVEREGLSYKQESEAPDELIHHSENNSKNYVEQIKSANREVYALYELARVFSSSLNLQDTLSLFADKIGELVPFDTMVIYLMNETGSEAKAVYTEGKNAAALLNRAIKPGEGATGYVLKKQQAVCNVNPGLDFSFCQIEFVQEYSAMSSLPLMAEDKMLGAVSLYSCALANYEDEHLRLLETVSRIAADTISKSLYHAETETRALTDAMTGLPNARSLQIQFEKEIARASRNGTTFQILMLDLDGFKAVNDTFGHKVGDKLLKEVAKVMRLQMRDYDFLARYAGDEFVAVIPETDNISVEDLCQRLEKAVRDFVLPVGDSQFARVGVSIGAASYPTGGNSLDQILIAADKAMYRVKAARKKRLKRDLKKLHVSVEMEIDTLLKNTNPSPITIRPTETINNSLETVVETDDNFVVELDESHIISSAIN